jgi:hypothetical protein
MSAEPDERQTYSKPYLNGRVYFIDGHKAVSVTSVLSKAYPKPALVTWAGKTVAAYALDHWRELNRMQPSERLEAMTKAPWSQNREGTARGSELHRYAEKLLSGTNPASLPVSGRIREHAKALAAFIADFGITFRMIETQVYNRSEGYAGTLDWLGVLPDGKVVLGDFKTNKSGIFAETAVQLTAYKFCEFYLSENDDEIRMPAVDETWGVHIRDDGTYAVYPMQSDEEVYDFFLNLKAVARALEHEGQYKGESITPEWVAA